MASLGAAPTTEQMEASSARRMRSTFASDAAEELPPAPRLARRERRSLRDTDRHAEREEERGDQDEDRAAPQQLAETGAAHHPKHKQYSLAPESRDSHYETAYDFASQLERHQEDRAAHASGGPHIERPAHADRAEARADAMGIPNGRNEGNTITAYKHVAPRTRREGLSGRAASSDLMSYFSGLVSKAKAEKADPPAHRYFRAKDARVEALAEVPRRRPAVARNLHVSEWRAAEQELGRGASRAHSALERLRRKSDARGGRGRERASSGDGGRRALRRDFSHDFEERLERAEKAISSLTAKAEHALAAKSKRLSQRETERLEGLGRAGSGVRDSFELAADQRAVADTKREALGDSGRFRRAPDARAPRAPTRRADPKAEIRRHFMSGREARRALDKSMDSWFASTTARDARDERALHGSPAQARRDIRHFFSSEAQRTRERDIIDERKLASPNEMNPAKTLRRQEQLQAAQERRTYDSAIQDALHPEQARKRKST
jgi:hypothetical protein